MSDDSTTKTLVGNWVEERQCQTLGLENDTHNPDGTLRVELHHRGHKGVFTTNLSVPVDSATTVTDSYLPPIKHERDATGKRYKLLSEHIYQAVTEEVLSEVNGTHHEVSEETLISVTQQDFHKDFSSAAKLHSFRSHHSLDEQPASFWSENLEAVTGVSKVCTHDLPFKRDATFSTPVENRIDQ